MTTAPVQDTEYVDLDRRLAEYSANRPALDYVKGRQDRPAADRYQLQFHRSRHTIRCMVLGNGAGKTTVAGIEADYWLQHKHPDQPGAVPTSRQ